ncbi:MAG: hypothetical protein GY724_08675 [Actinomycetia bacterium]|nr:hypothetical protein [Actinomycetes bacterium]MCP4227709.1 hypothetical protein [Actinomycetes bacterium]MCP5033071.1 hypothetical protein [Actinomycetes bacterium]
MRLLPILKPAEWNGISRGARVHMWLGSTNEPLVFVGYAWESDEELTYVTRQADDDPNAIVKVAFENLEVYEVGLETVAMNGSKLVVSAGNPFAAEKVLCESHMLEVHDLLASEKVVVSIAKRGAMLASAWDCPPEARATLINLHLEAWKTADHSEVITDHLVVFEAGVRSSTLAVSTNGEVDGWL